jgi:hypothetical protein
MVAITAVHLETLDNRARDSPGDCKLAGFCGKSEGEKASALIARGAIIDGASPERERGGGCWRGRWN